MRTRRAQPPPQPPPKKSKHRPRGAIEVLVVTDKEADMVIVHFAGHLLQRIAIRGRSAALAFAEVIKQHALELPTEAGEEDGY
jgi:hypothetical protein